MNYTLADRIRDIIGNIAWKVFLWSIQETEDKYWNQIYEQEKFRIDYAKESPNDTE